MHHGWKWIHSQLYVNIATVRLAAGAVHQIWLTEEKYQDSSHTHTELTCSFSRSRRYTGGIRPRFTPWDEAAGRWVKVRTRPGLVSHRSHTERQTSLFRAATSGLGGLMWPINVDLTVVHLAEHEVLFISSLAQSWSVTICIFKHLAVQVFFFVF